MAVNVQGIGTAVGYDLYVAIAWKWKINVTQAAVNFGGEGGVG
jgi:hypothetical protein